MEAESVNYSPPVYSFLCPGSGKWSICALTSSPICFLMLMPLQFLYLVVSGSCFLGVLCLSAMAGPENRACKLQLAHDLSSSVNTKWRVCLQMTASRCSSNLSDIAGRLCRQIFPSCGKNYLTSLFTPLLPPTAEKLLSVASCSRSGICLKQGNTVGVPQPRLGLIIPYATISHDCFFC